MRLLLLLALSAAVSAQTYTLPGQQITIVGTTCTQAGTSFICNGAPPPPGVTCPDGSQHPAGYICPVAPPGNIVCPGFTKTLVMVVDWNNPTRLLTVNYGGFNANDIVVYQFTTGGGSSIDNNLPRVAGAEYSAGAANRIAAMSDKPCDFVGLPFFAATVTSSAITIPFTVNNPNNYGFYPILNNHSTYFINVKNAPDSGCVTACNMFFDLSRNGSP